MDTRQDSKHEDETEGESEDKHSGGMKYVQILFYYVQDASLFKIPLPSVVQEASTPNVIVQFLEFSPNILNIYSKASDLYFVYTTAVLKVLYQSFFGLVMITFHIYVLQESLSIQIKLFSEDESKAHANISVNSTAFLSEVSDWGFHPSSVCLGWRT